MWTCIFVCRDRERCLNDRWLVLDFVVKLVLLWLEVYRWFRHVVWDLVQAIMTRCLILDSVLLKNLRTCKLILTLIVVLGTDLYCGTSLYSLVLTLNLVQFLRFSLLFYCFEMTLIFWWAAIPHHVLGTLNYDWLLANMLLQIKYFLF